MCFYDQHTFACGDYKWGNFKQHCNREYRIGETCGMRLVYQTYATSAKCKTCERIEVKARRKAAEIERMTRWRHDPKRQASYAKAWDIVQDLDREIQQLDWERQVRRSQGLGSRR